MTLFFTSDTHFNHKNIIEYAERPFRDLEHMNEEIIRRYNSRVEDDDLVIFLGDIFFSDKAWAEAAMKRMKGHKKLVMGNHDRLSVSKLKSWGFEEVWRKYTWGYVAGKQCVLSHYPSPYGPDLGGMEFVLHGHTHSRDKRRGRHIHVGVDAWDFYPVSEVEIVELMEAHREELGLDE